MAEGDKTVRSGHASRGGIRRDRTSVIGSVAANAVAPVIELVARLSPDDLTLSARSREVLQPALEARGYTLLDERLPYNDSSPKATLVDGPTRFCLMHIHRDLLPDKGQKPPHDFSHLGFCLWKHGVQFLRIVGEDVEFLPVAFDRWFRTWQDTVGVEARFVGWSRIEALRDADDPVEALPLYLSLDMAAPADGMNTDQDEEGDEPIPPVVPLPDKPDLLRPGVFISYSHADDDKWIGLLRIYVKEPLERIGYEVWDDSDIEPGDMWRQRIDAALARATIVVLLVSQNFENSQFIQENELRAALEAAHGGVKPLHSLLGSYQWAYGPPTDDRPPLDELDDTALRRTLVAIRTGIQKALEGGGAAG
jgi:hypothetical protein